MISYHLPVVLLSLSLVYFVVPCFISYLLQTFISIHDILTKVISNHPVESQFPQQGLSFDNSQVLKLLKNMEILNSDMVRVSVEVT